LNLAYSLTLFDLFKTAMFGFVAIDYNVFINYVYSVKCGTVEFFLLLYHMWHNYGTMSHLPLDILGYV